MKSSLFELNYDIIRKQEEDILSHEIKSNDQEMKGIDKALEIEFGSNASKNKKKRHKKKNATSRTHKIPKLKNDLSNIIENPQAKNLMFKHQMIGQSMMKFLNQNCLLQFIGKGTLIIYSRDHHKVYIVEPDTLEV
jgi:hypothetical protein